MKKAFALAAICASLASCSDEKDSSLSQSVATHSGVAVPESCNELIRESVEIRRHKSGKSTVITYYDEAFCRNKDGAYVVLIKEVGDDEWTERVYEF